MRTSALFCAKNVEIFETYGVSARTRVKGVWVSQCGHFAHKKEWRVNFSRFYAEVFYEWPLKTNGRIFKPNFSWTRKKVEL